MENNKIFSQRLKETRIEKNITQEILAKSVGFNKSTIQRYESGEINNLKLPIVQAIADCLGVNPAWLVGKSSNKYLLEPPLPPNALPVPPQCQLAVIGRVSAGSGVYAYDDILSYEFADERYCNGEYFFLKVVGDSMTPKIEDGDLVLVHKQPMIESGNYGVVLVDNEDGCVKIVKYGKDWIELHSVNPYYPVRRFEGAEIQLIKVVGKVIEIKRKL